MLQATGAWCVPCRGQQASGGSLRRVRWAGNEGRTASTRGRLRRLAAADRVAHAGMDRQRVIASRRRGWRPAGRGRARRAGMDTGEQRAIASRRRGWSPAGVGRAHRAGRWAGASGSGGHGEKSRFGYGMEPNLTDAGPRSSVSPQTSPTATAAHKPRQRMFLPRMSASHGRKQENVSLGGRIRWNGLDR